MEALGPRPGPWVLLGGPPCQAYSLAGRSRNQGIDGYRLEEDHRSALYKEYLKVIWRFEPTVLITENVKGLLSARHSGASIFANIRQDLECPGRALKKKIRCTYRIFSLAVPESKGDLLPDSLRPQDFIIRSGGSRSSSDSAPGHTLWDKGKAGRQCRLPD